MEDSTFDLLLSPKLLFELASRLDRTEVLDHLRAFLTLLQAEKAKTGSAGMAAEDPEVSVLPAENQTPPISQRLAARKQAVLQMLSLQLCCCLDWSLAALSAGLSMAQQQQLFDCLTSATSTQKLLTELPPDDVSGSLTSLSSSPSSVFALTLFFRWVVHSACALNLPVPIGSKAQIHAAALSAARSAFSSSPAAGPELPIPTGGSELGGPLHQWLARLVPLALKVLQAILEEDLHCSLPTMERVAIEDNVVAFSVEGGVNKRKKESGAAYTQWRGLILFDLARYHFCVEDYEQTRTYLKSMESLKPPFALSDDEEAAMLRGMAGAVGVFTSSYREVASHFLQHFTPGESKQMLQLLKREGSKLPFYWRINLELLARYHDGEASKDVSVANLSTRVEHCQPPSAEHFAFAEKGALCSTLDDGTRQGARKKEMLAAMIEDSRLPQPWMEKVNLTPKLSDGKSR